MYWKLLFLPLVFSSAVNQFEKFIEPGFIKNTFFVFLTLQERMKFALTCRRYYYEFIETEYDQLIKEIPSPHDSYRTAQESLKADIRKLWRYFTLEMIARKRNDKFTIDNFYEMMVGSFFTADFVKSAIQSANFREIDSVLGFIFSGYGNIVDPCFPEISLILFKTETDQAKKDLLIQNALIFPYLFDPFLKHLTDNVYEIERDELLSVIRIKYPHWHYNLQWYQKLIKIYYSYEIQLFNFIGVILITCIHQLFFHVFKNNIILVTIFTLWVAKLLDCISELRYQTFSLNNPIFFKTFYRIYIWSRIIYHRLFRRRNTH